ncbi:pr domain zinc finger protein 16 [Limosa lapponica baueri]|uniref:Pr domain zinc finger protein 16 n=1 Tax=Limosa lapponica baueri TaxID=1758121 RepID=A0A2I0TKM2_LIMLA|nr:pr domain zinc finger protein 16 [Limosa lapponica baueri]
MPRGVRTGVSSVGELVTNQWKTVMQIMLGILIYYKVIKEIEPGEELLVYLKEGGYSLGNMAPSMEVREILQHPRISVIPWM